MSPVRVSTYFWNKTPNFGDTISVPLLGHFSDVHPVWADPEDAHLLCVGSNIDRLPRSGWVGIIAGAGQLNESTKTDFTKALVLGVRGYLTLENITTNSGNVVIGDPALMASELVTPHPDRYAIGVVPHVTDSLLYPNEVAKAARGGYAKPVLIDPTGDPLDVASRIASCQKIVASALHGLIVADSFGIPRRAEKFEPTNPWEGGLFKYEDYASSIGQDIQWGELQLAPQSRILEIQGDLFNMFAEVKRITHAPAS